MISRTRFLLMSTVTAAVVGLSVIFLSVKSAQADEKCYGQADCEDQCSLRWVTYTDEGGHATTVRTYASGSGTAKAAVGLNCGIGIKEITHQCGTYYIQPDGCEGW